MSPSFFETVSGRKFFHGTIPDVIEQVKRLNDNLEKLILLMEEGSLHELIEKLNAERIDDEDEKDT